MIDFISFLFNSMKLLVFKMGNEDKVITLFDRYSFCHYVDGIHLNDWYYLKKNFEKLPHRLVYLNDRGEWDLDFGIVQDYEKPNTPDFVVYFNEFDEIDTTDWYRTSANE